MRMDVSTEWKFGVERELLISDRHGRSHNIAAECCVRSKSERPAFESMPSKVGGRFVENVDSVGSCLMMTLCSKRSSAVVVAGLAEASIEYRDSTRDGAGVSSLQGR
jgi:hypothetical protein